MTGDWTPKRAGEQTAGRLGQGVRPDAVQIVPQAIHRMLQQAALLIAGSKLWVETSEFVASPILPRGLLALFGVMRLIVLLLRPRATPPPTDLAD